MQWNPDASECHKMLLVLICFVIRTQIFSPYLLHVSVKISIDSFSPGADLSIVKIEEIVLIRIGVPIDQNSQSVIIIQIS